MDQGSGGKGRLCAYTQRTARSITGGQAIRGKGRFSDRIQLNGDPDRSVTLIVLYATGAYSYSEIAEYFGIHLATVGRVFRGRCCDARPDSDSRDPDSPFSTVPVLSQTGRWMTDSGLAYRYLWSIVLRVTLSLSIRNHHRSPVDPADGLRSWPLVLVNYRPSAILGEAQENSLSGPSTAAAEAATETAWIFSRSFSTPRLSSIR